MSIKTTRAELHLGDALDVLPGLDTERVGMVLADMPYGTTKAPWDNPLPYKAVWDVLKDIPRDVAVLHFGCEPFASYLRLSNIKDYRYDIIWEKSKATGWLNSKVQPMRAHENVLVFYGKKPVYNPQMVQGDAYDKGVRKPQTEGDIYGSFDQAHIKSSGLRYPRSVQYFPTAEAEGKTFHKTQKPLRLLEWLIRTYSSEGDTVLDFTMGSGSAGVAAINTGRQFLGVEKDRAIYDVAVRRIQEAELEAL